MADLATLLAATAGLALLVLLCATLARPGLRFWPTPGERTWQSYLFWPLFRGLNVLCFVLAWLHPGGALALPTGVRLAAAGLLAAGSAVFAYAFIVLGRDNSYGARDGLVTAGIYRWTRNPQNVMLMAVYTCLALAADSGPAYLACAGMVAVYYLMILAEEPWLLKAYGEAYRSYCAQVPRIFNWRLAAARLFGRPAER